MPVTVTRSGRVSNAPRGWREYVIELLSPSANSGSVNGGDSAPPRGSRSDIETQQLNETNDNDIQQELDLENISDSDISLNESINETNNGSERGTDDEDEEGEEGEGDSGSVLGGDHEEDGEGEGGAEGDENEVHGSRFYDANEINDNLNIVEQNAGETEQNPQDETTGDESEVERNMSSTPAPTQGEDGEGVGEEDASWATPRRLPIPEINLAEEYVSRREYNALDEKYKFLESENSSLRQDLSETRQDQDDLKVQVEKLTIAVVAAYGTMLPGRVVEIRKENTDIIETQFGEIINVGTDQAEKYNRKKLDMLRDDLQSGGHNCNSVIIDMENIEPAPSLPTAPTPATAPAAAPSAAAPVNPQDGNAQRPSQRQSIPASPGVLSNAPSNAQRQRQQQQPATAPVQARAGVPTYHAINHRNITAQMQWERQDMDRREKNLIMTGIRETDREGDWEAIHRILNYIGAQHRESQIVRLVRLGRRRAVNSNGRGRPIKIIFEHKAAAREILDKSPRLGGSRTFGMVSLKRDLPLNQRLDYNSLNLNSLTEAAYGANAHAPVPMLPAFDYINERQINTGYVNTNNLVHLTNGLHGPMENRQTQLDNRYYIEQMYGDGDNMATERGGGEEGVGGEMPQGNWMWGRGQGGE